MKRRALIADDEEVVQDMMRDFLRSKNFTVDSVSTGRAVYALGSLNYDLIILDHFMPDWNGLEGISLAKAFGNVSKVILITGNADLITESYDFPMIEKPFRLEEVSKVLNKMFEL